MISENVGRLLAEIPAGVEVVAAAKTRSAAEIIQALEGGIKIIGENYVQEAQSVRPAVALLAQWHCIGHLQTNKVKKAIEIFDLIQTVDSIRLAREISRQCEKAGKTMPVLIEVNSGREPQKSGVLPEETILLVREISNLPNIKVSGLMTMGPFEGDPELSRPYFIETRKIFDELKRLAPAKVEMKYLSMGMTNSYRVAIAEGANMIRVGTLIFGEMQGRQSCDII